MKRLIVHGPAVNKICLQTADEESFSDCGRVCCNRMWSKQKESKALCCKVSCPTIGILKDTVLNYMVILTGVGVEEL